jgi:hypothetical protein
MSNHNAQIKTIRRVDVPMSGSARSNAGNIGCLDVCELVGSVSAKALVAKEVCSAGESSDVPLCSEK